MEDVQQQAARLVQEYWQQANPAYGTKLKDLEAGRAILAGDVTLQIAALFAVYEGPKHRPFASLTFLLEILAHSLPLTPEDTERLLQCAANHYVEYRTSLWKSVLKYIERFTQRHRLTPTMCQMLRQMSESIHEWSSVDYRKLKARIAELLGENSAGLPDPSEAWAAAALAETADFEAWASVFNHTTTADGGKPSGKWLKEAEGNRWAVGEVEFRQRVTAWLRAVASPVAFDVPVPVYDDYVQVDINTNYVQANEAYRTALREYHNRISEKNISILKGLAWYCAPLGDAELARALGHMAEAAFGNVRERGAWAKSAGNAAIWALGQMPGGVGVGPLARLRTRLRDRSALKLIASSIEAAARNAGMTVDELEDLAVPTGGLDADGMRRETFGEDGSATLTLNTKNAKTNLQWFGSDGKERKAAPAAVKKNWPAEVKALKAAEEEVKQALSAQSARFDRFLLDEREWTYAQWQERYLSHPILGNLARRLIWTVDAVPVLEEPPPGPRNPLPASPSEQGEGQEGGLNPILRTSGESQPLLVQVSWSRLLQTPSAASSRGWNAGAWRCRRRRGTRRGSPSLPRSYGTG